MNFRHEYKHRINPADLIILRTRLKHICKRDVHAGADGTYLIKSLYLDNVYDKALHEKIDGVNKREKFRIRYYNNDASFIRLEKKSKINGLCNKESAPITQEECEKILHNDIAFLKDSTHTLCRELYAKMHTQLLRPVCIVAYRRESFTYAPGNTRITLDTQLGGSYNIHAFLKPDTAFTRMSNAAMLEVKWDAFLPELIRNAVQIGNRKSAAFSKYAAVRF